MTQQTRYYDSVDGSDTLYRIDPNGDTWLSWRGISTETGWTFQRCNDDVDASMIERYEQWGLVIAIEPEEAAARLAQNSNTA